MAKKRKTKAEYEARLKEVCEKLEDNLHNSAVLRRIVQDLEEFLEIPQSYDVYLSCDVLQFTTTETLDDVYDENNWEISVKFKGQPVEIQDTKVY